MQGHYIEEPEGLHTTTVNGQVRHAVRKWITHALIAGGLVWCWNLRPQPLAQKFSITKRGDRPVIEFPRGEPQGEYISQVFEATRINSVKVVRP